MASIVVFTDWLDETISFYRALGVSLADQDHGDGLVHTAGELDGVNVAVFASSLAGKSRGWRVGGTTFLGFWVTSLERVIVDVEPIGKRLLCDHQQRRCGCRIVLADPDGRAVEINQRDHCPPLFEAVGGSQRGDLFAAIGHVDSSAKGPLAPGEEIEAPRSWP